MRLWYLRRAVPWSALLVSLSAAGLLTLLLHRWPEVSIVGLPLVAASCAAGAGFVYDEPAAAIASVTPRAGWWRGSARLLAALPPLTAVLVLLAVMPDELRLDRNGWWLIGAAFVLLAVVPAAWAARSQVGKPGGVVAGGAVLLGIAPVVLSMMLGWEPIYPFGEFATWVQAFWVAVGLLAAVGCAAAMVAFGRLDRARGQRLPPDVRAIPCRAARGWDQAGR